MGQVHSITPKPSQRVKESKSKRSSLSYRLETKPVAAEDAQKALAFRSLISPSPSPVPEFSTKPDFVV